MSRLPIISTDPEPLPARGKIGQPGWLADRQGRSLRYLRLSVTDRCDLKCTYCMPVTGVPPSAREDVLTFEEITKIVRVFKRLGVQTVRLTGGEPLVRKDVDALVGMIKTEVGIDDIAMTSNATALLPLADRLVKAGLKRINISLDSIDPEAFRKITRGGDLKRVVSGIEAIREAGIAEIKTNSVVVRGVNDAHLGDLVRWAWARNVTPRFIELMPLGEAANLGRGAVVSVAEMKQTLSEQLGLQSGPAKHRADRGPASYLEHDGKKVGFIGAVTENFCDRCNRVRVTARGEIRACLASPDGFSLRALVRAGLGAAEIEAEVRRALFGKLEGHGFYAAGTDRHHDVDMSAIGG